MAWGGTIAKILGPAMVGAGAASSALSGTEAARTYRNSGTENTSGTGRTRRLLRKQQEDMLDPLATRATQLMTNPAATLEPIRQARRGAVNESFSGVEDGLAEKLLAFGGGKSGKFGTALRQAEMARLGGLAGVDADMTQLILDQQREGSSLAERLLGMTFESETSDSRTGSSASSGVAPGSSLASGIAGGASGISSLMTLLQLDKLLKGGQ